MANEFSEYLVQSHEALAGELMGRFLDADAKLRMANTRVKGLLEKVQDVQQLTASLAEANEKIEQLEIEIQALNQHNKDLQERNSELSLDRQTAMEAETIGSEQEDVEHNQAEAE